MASSCTLCGIPAGRYPVSRRFDAEERIFCCAGCANVYTILLESGIVPVGGDYRNTDLFRESLRLGLVSQETPLKPVIPADAETREVLYQVSGMWCSSCAWLIERALAAEPGIVSVEVLFAADVAKVKYCPQYLPPGRIIGRIAALGYRAAEYQRQTGQDHAGRRDMLLRLGVAFFLWLNVMTVSLVVYASYWEPISDSARSIVPFVLMALATPALVYSARPIFRGAWIGLRNFSLRMEVLLAGGILAAYLYSAVQAFTGGHHYYFDTSCAIITLVLLGNFLERAAKERTAQGITLLYRMMPTKARLLVDGQEKFVAIDAVQPGMVFMVKAGESIPADGLVTAGESHVDESVLTGESALREKRPGDPVASGSLSTDGVLEVCASHVGPDSTLSRVVQSVEAAMSSRADIERTADGAARVFVPVVTCVAVATLIAGLLTGSDPGAALLRAIAVLVIACPCALGIATPLAVTAVVGACSRLGILIRDSRVLETVRKVDVALFDKTGTVTEGDFGVTGVVFSRVAVLAGSGEAEAADPLALAAALECYSEHPIGRAIVRYAAALGIPQRTAGDIALRPGMGIEGRAGGMHVFAGNRRMVAECGIALDPDLDAAASEQETRSHTVTFFGCEREAAGFFALGDRVRPESAAVIRKLRDRGIHVSLISGDSAATTASVAAELGIDDFRAEVLPSGKLEIIRKYQARGATVAMIGDGINDAPALAAADLGIALSSGTDLAMQAAPVVLMARGLDRVDMVFAASRTGLRIIRQNLFWAFFYNALGITLAISGILNPIMAAGAMVLSSLSVIGNSMRLRKLSIPSDR